MFLAMLLGSLVGLSLGLTGSGGSIFAVPLLVYGLGTSFREAVAVSLAVVGSTALYGALLQAKKGQVLWGAGTLLGAGGILSVPLGSRIGALLPQRLSLLLFSLLMVVIAVRMLRGVRGSTDEVSASWISCTVEPAGTPRFTPQCAMKLLGAGMVTGILSGIFGVGGGFLLVPALLVVLRIPAQRAMATSLVAIFLIALSGFVANYKELAGGQISTELGFLAGAAAGMTVGVQMKSYFPEATLRLTFSLLVLATALFVVVKNLSGVM
jgi:hypothetical protein